MIINLQPIYFSTSFVPMRRQKGDLDARYAPHAYALFAQLIEDYASSMRPVVPDRRFMPMQLGWLKEGTRYKFVLSAVENGAVCPNALDVFIGPDFTLQNAMEWMRIGWQSVPELNP